MVFDFLRRLAGGGGNSGAGEPAARETYEGLEILAMPVSEGQVWRVAGRIQRVGDDDGDGHEFVRADTMASHDEAVRMSLLKGRQLIDEQGSRLLPSE